MQYLLPSARGLHPRNSLNASIAVSKLNHLGFVVQSSPVSSLTKPLYATFFLPGYDLTFGFDPLTAHLRVTVVWMLKWTSSWKTTTRSGSSISPI